MAVYQVLTERDIASSTAITPTTLIHIVTTGDTSQGNPAGSSYKAELQQLSSIFSGGTFSGGSGNCITDLYVSNIHSCSPLNINPLDEGNVYFGSTSGVTIDVINNSFGVGINTPTEKLHVSGGDMLVENTNGKFITNIQNTTGPLTVLSGDSSGVSRIGVAAPTFGSVTLGVRGPSAGSPGFGKQGDGFIYSSNANNGLNLISSPGTGTDDYIRFYAGTQATSTPDIHIQGSGVTRGYVGIGTETPTEILDVNGKTKTTTLQVTSGATNGYVLVSDSIGNAIWQSASGVTSGVTFWTASTGVDAIVVKNSGSVASGLLSLAQGYQTIAGGDYSHSEGYYNIASGIASHSEGYQTKASGDGSHAEGGSSISLISGGTASGNGSHAEGYNTLASGQASHAEGVLTSATTVYSHAEGQNTLASGTASHAEGYQATASGVYSHAEGYDTTAKGDYSHAEGYQTIASGQTSHAEGSNTIAVGGSSHAEGKYSVAGGNQSHAEGAYTTANGDAAHAEGELTTAGGDYSHAEGKQTTASGQSSHSGGDSSIASGLNSFIHSSGSTISGNRSAILGGGSITGLADDTVYVPDFVIKKTALVPTSSADSVGENGSITWDNTYFYWKANGQWLRVSGSTF